ncbi:MAG: glycosyltransferase family 4 protein [Actinomycetota bacterium]
MAKRKVLYVCHNHPAIRAGGAEAYALELYESMRESDEVEPLFLVRTGPPLSRTGRYHEGTLVTGVNHDPNQYFIYTEFGEFDWFLGTTLSKPVISRYLRDFLAALQPDVVHFQHTLFIGYEAIREVRNVLPDAAIVYTLHEFLPICHRQGQMLRTMNEEPCMEESPRRCHECFPDIAPQEFFMRKRFIQSHLGLVDQFLAPSRFLLERYVDWGIPREKIKFEDYGRRPIHNRARSDTRTHNRFAFFGQLSLYKGINVLLKAMGQVADAGVDAELTVYGANLELQPQEFRDEFARLLDMTRGNVTFVGEYKHDDLPALMEKVDWVVVPSIWWENSPLVIQEAFMYRRPVICSDIGGMAEKVRDGVDGLHFRAGDPERLAETIAHAAKSRNLWAKLRGSIPDIYTMDEQVAALTRLYEELSRRKSKSATQARTRQTPEGIHARGG